jgi:predicted Zn finger-like uncharacterized protein
VFTQCPDCGTVFRVTATVLRAARGQVRCGVCDATFDALQYLMEEVDAEPAGGDGPFLPEGAPDAPSAAAARGAPGAAAGGGPGRAGAAPPRSFPLEELDDPIDVLAGGSSAPAPDFPPAEAFAPARGPAPPAPAPPPRANDAPTAGPFGTRAGRHTPSADEDRALAEIAAALARDARQPGPAAPVPAPAGAPADAESVADSLEIELLDPSAAENIVLEGEEIPASALEFDLPAEEWDRVFVPDAEAPTIPPLDPALARAQAAAFGAGAGGAEPAAPASRPAERDSDEEAPDELDLELDLDDDGDDDDGARELAKIRAAQSASLRAGGRASPPPPAAPVDDPLARTDEFPPLRVTLAEEAAAGVLDTPNARPRPATGVTPADFDALVAAAAARAAAEVAARTGAPAAPAVEAGAQARARAPEPAERARPAPEPEPPLVGRRDEPAPVAADAEDAWFDARRDLAPEGARIADASSPDELIQFDAQRFQAIVRGRTRRPWWLSLLLGAGVGVLGLALVAQAVNYWRDTLAQHPIFGPPLQELYARLGVPLEPHWDLAAYEVKQWGATSDVKPGTLRVRASIVNRAARAQPHPLLRVTLLDRFSGKVARREFAPAEYLPGHVAPTALLAPGARVDADLVIADPGSEAIGFELDVCLARHGVLSCASDARPAGAG